MAYAQKFKIQGKKKGKVVGTDESSNGAKLLYLKMDGVVREIYVSDETAELAVPGEEIELNITCQAENFYLREFIE